MENRLFEIIYIVFALTVLFCLFIGIIITVIDIFIGKKWTEIFRGDNRDD